MFSPHLAVKTSHIFNTMYKCMHQFSVLHQKLQIQKYKIQHLCKVLNLGFTFTLNEKSLNCYLVVILQLSTFVYLYRP